MAEPQPPHELPKLPRGATWHALWVLPLLVLLAWLLVPWSDKPATVFTDLSAGGIARARALQASQAQAQGQVPGADGSASRPAAVEVRLMPTPAPAASR